MGEERVDSVLTRHDIVSSYKVAEFVTVARDGSPVCWPMAPDFERGRLVFSTGYMYPTKARNAQRNPQVAALFSDPTASHRSDSDPLVLVQGRAEVFDQDIQHNTERYVDQLMRKGPLPFRLMLSIPPVRRAMAGYLARIFIEVVPQEEHIWTRGEVVPATLREASCPTAFVPGPGISVPDQVYGWLPRYPRPPVLAYIDTARQPAIVRTEAVVRSDHVEIGSSLVTHDGAPACLTYHRLVGNYRANDSFLIRGHFDTAGRLIPEKLVGYGGTGDDRGVGSAKALSVMRDLSKRLPTKLAREGRPSITARPSAKD